MDDTQPTPDAPVEATTEQAAPTQVDAPAEDAAETTPQAPVFDLAKALDEAPAEELRRHPKFAGIVGSEKQQWRAEYEAQQRAILEAEARAKAEADLEELANKHPVEFADKWLSSQEAKKQQDRLTQLEQNAQQEIGRHLGAAMHAIPEWGDAAGDAAVLARLAQAIQGKTGGEMLAAWNSTALDIVADRRAQARFEAAVAERIKAERTAWETEAAAQGFRLGDRPDLVRAGRATSADPEPDFLRDPRAWDAWWTRNK